MIFPEVAMHTQLRFVKTFALASIMFAAGCQPAPQPQQKAAAPPDPAPINALRDQFGAAYNSGDAAAVANLYSEDGVALPAHQPAIEGRAAIQQWLQGFFAENTAKLVITSQELQIAGDWAYDRGMFTMTLTPKKGGGKPIEDAGKYLVILKRQADGAWKVHRDMDNSNNPMAPPPGARKK
jgi:uncharacterized protein (TIGR02246 family)